MTRSPRPPACQRLSVRRRFPRGLRPLRSAGLLLAARPLLAALALLPAFGLPLAPALAAGSDTAPLSLVPAPVQAPASTPPAPGTKPASRDSAQPAASRDSAGNGEIAIEDLASPGPDSAGLLDASSGGLPAPLWAGTSRATLVPLLESLPAIPRSPLLQQLSRRLLLTSAAVPAATGQAPASQKDAGQDALLQLRLGLLLQLGLEQDAKALIQILPAAARTSAINSLLAQAFLVDGRTDEACTLAQEEIGRSAEVFWQKAMAFCHQLAGRDEAASIQVSMLREQNVDDTAFFWAAESLSGLRVLPLNSYPQPSPLTAAMLRAAGKSYPAGTLVEPAPWLARVVALDSKTDPLVRVTAAELAFARGGISRDDALAALEALPAGSDHGKPLSALAADDSARGAALLWQATREQTTAPAQAAVITHAWQQAARRGLGLTAARLYAPVVEKMVPSAELLPFSETAGRILYAAGRLDAARSWYRLAVASASQDANAAQAADVLWPLERLSAASGFSDAPPPDRLQAWRSRMSSRAQSQDVREPGIRRVTRQENRLLTLLQATGDHLPMEQWAGLWSVQPGEDSGSTPSGSRWQALKSLESQGSRPHSGLTVGLVLLAADNKPLAGLSDAVAGQMVSALRAAGLEQEGRQLAIEMAVEAGL